MRKYQVTLTGLTPILLHHDDIEWADRMTAWRLDPKNTTRSKAGDDRTPPFRWLGCLYHHNGVVVIPTDNVMSALLLGGANVKTGQGHGTYKSRTQSGILAPQVGWPLLVGGQSIPTAPLFEAMETRTWEGWNDLATSLGFSLFVKRAGMRTTRHVRVRPRFDAWSASGTLLVKDEGITAKVLAQIGAAAGETVGIGDWRPSSPKRPGSWGTFTFMAKDVTD